jgi:REP element-mobilizing transposase RayT
MTFYRRRLPHWQPEGASIFLTWRLHGSLPRSTELAAARGNATEGQRFAALDHLMDRAVTGPAWLKDPRVATCVVETLFRAEKQWQLYELFAWVVMCNHVHLLLNPHKPLADVTRAVKKNSARAANQILGRSGMRFWQDESDDHWVRDNKEFDRIARYIEWNPVRAGLVGRIEDWPWSSATEKLSAGQVGNLPHEVEM